MHIICEFCNQPIEPTHAQVHKVLGWANTKNGKATGQVSRLSAPLGYAHKVCLETKPADDQISLF